LSLQVPGQIRGFLTDSLDSGAAANKRYLFLGGLEIDANGSREAVVRLLVRSHGAAEGRVDNLRCKSLGQDVAASATFADVSGNRFHAIVGLRESESSAQRWQYLGAAVSPLHGETNGRPWVGNGAWTSGHDVDTETVSIAGGTVNEAEAVYAVVKDGQGTVLDDQIEQGSVIFVSHGSLDFRTARLSLNDSAGHALWEGPLLNR
jgi:hypothetical protein